MGVLSIFAYNAFMVRIANLSALWREWTDELLVQLAHRTRAKEVSLVSLSPVDAMATATATSSPRSTSRRSPTSFSCC